MEAIILAGGRGTRLSPIVSDKPKVLADVSGKPFLSYVLDSLYSCGVTHAVLAVGYMADSIRAVYGNSYEGILLDYSVEDSPLGTGGAIKRALTLCADSNIIIVNGDTVFDVELAKMMDAHLQSGSLISVALKHMKNFERYGTVETDCGRITAFNEKKPCLEGLINGGVYIINRFLMRDIRADSFSFEKEVLEKPEFSKNAFISEGYFIDIGVPEDYEAAQQTLTQALSVKTRRALFLDRDGTVNIDKHHVYRVEDFEFVCGMPRLIKRYRDEGYLVIVITNQAGVAKGLYTEQDVQRLHDYINEALSRDYKTRIDAFFYCPHHPQGALPEYTRACTCRKPGAGLIYEAVEFFAKRGIAVSLSDSILIGDKDSDIEAGKTAGIADCRLVRYIMKDAGRFRFRRSFNFMKNLDGGK